MELSLKLRGETFSDALRDPSSTQYQLLDRHFIRRVNTIIDYTLAHTQALLTVGQGYSIGGPRAKSGPGVIFTGPLSIMLKSHPFFFLKIFLKIFLCHSAFIPEWVLH